MTELVGSLSDILRVEFSEEKQDLLVFDADLKPVPPGELNWYNTNLLFNCAFENKEE